MESSVFLQIFLLLNIFIMGVLVSIAIRHAYAHFKPQTEKTRPQQPVHLPPEVKERLIQKSQANFQAVLERSASELQHDLKSTVSQLDKQLEKLGSGIIENEMKRYHDSLEQLRMQTEAAINGAQSEISKHQQDLKEKLAIRQIELEKQLQEQMAAEKETLLQNIDTKLADAVASFLNETLKHEVDLGAQSSYLVSMLEEHKAEIKKGTIDEN